MYLCSLDDGLSKAFLYSLSIDYDRTWVCQAINMTGHCIYSGHQQLLNDDDDMIIIETIMIYKVILENTWEEPLLLTTGWLTASTTRCLREVHHCNLR